MKVVVSWIDQHSSTQISAIKEMLRPKLNVQKGSFLNIAFPAVQKLY